MLLIFLNEQAKDLPFSLIKKKRVGRLTNGKLSKKNVVNLNYAVLFPRIQWL
jgi:hypothetical protein